MMSDFREKVFEIIDKVRSMYPYRIAGRSDTYDHYNEAWRDCADQIEVQIEAYLKDVPEKNVGEWIPISERLPEENEAVLTQAQFKYDTKMAVSARVDFNYWTGWNTRDINIVAWMPMPEPYRGGDA